MDTFGSRYTAATVDITDAAGAGADTTAEATIDVGAVTAIDITDPGSGYVTPGGIRKFIDPLPGLCDPDPVRAAAPACAGSKYIPLAVRRDEDAAERSSV